MIPALTSQIVANNALQLVGDNQPLVSAGAPNFDQSPAGVALQQLYAPTVATVMRQFGWDLARNTQPLALTGNPAPFPWAFEYTYPANCLEVLQVAPPSIADPNDPLPVNWSVGNDVVGGDQVKVIFSNLAGALVVYNNGPAENTWDPLFTEAVVRLLASKLAMAIAGRSDTAQTLLQSGSAMEQIAETRGDV
jgi:hypothetical protein